MPRYSVHPRRFVTDWRCARMSRQAASSRGKRTNRLYMAPRNQAKITRTSNRTITPAILRIHQNHPRFLDGSFSRLDGMASGIGPINDEQPLTSFDLRLIVSFELFN